jgi:serine/threonine protein kinase
MSETKINFFNKLKSTAINKFSSVPDITGQTVEDFYVEKRMEIPSGEADIYLCSGTENHAGKKFILKYYRRENAVKPEVIAKLRSISSPYVAPVSGFGEFQGHQYTIRPYYEFPALSDVLSAGTKFSENELKTFIIPSAIEGLKVVHDAGILHRDLKPGNLIPDDKGEHVVLIDFGISSNSDGVTFVMTQPGMTPFYAAPEAIQGIYHKETDYYALGITIFELFTGYTPFQNPDISGEEAAKLAAISKIEFPDNFPENLRKLVLGLTYKDISHRNEKDNPNRRWGYDEVKRWLNGENVPVPGELTGTSGAESVKQSAFQPYRFNGKTYTEEKELLLAMLQQPDEALKDLGRGILTHHYFILDEKKGALCSSAENKIGKNSLENIIHLCTLIYDLKPDIKEIMFNNRMLNGLEVIGKNIIDNVIKEAVKTGNLQSSDSEIIKQVKEFALSGIPEEYASTILKNTGYAKIFTNVKKIWSEGQTIYSDTELALILGHSICNDHRIPVHGKVYDSPEIFRKEMKHLAEKDRNAYTEFIQKAKADLNFLEKMLPSADSRNAITEALAESTYAIFGDNEYFFKNGEDFENYVDKLVQEEKPYELQNLFYRYRTPLKDVSKKVWNTDSRTKLEKIVSGFIHIGEHLFTGEESCRKFLNEVQERGQKEPAYLLGFIKAHKESLDRAVKSFPEIKEAVTDLYSSGNKLVLFGEHLFNNSTEFTAFIDNVIAKGNNDPDYLIRFTEYHQQEISKLLNKDTLCQEVLNKLLNIRNLNFF